MKINVLQVLINHYQRQKSSLYRIKQIAHVIEIKPKLTREEIERLKECELEKQADIAYAMDVYERGLRIP